jgi:site-specific recombinase XerD
VTLDQAMPGFLDYLDAVARKAPATISAYRADLARFRTFLGDQVTMPLADVSAPLVEHWMASMRHLSDSTVRRSLNALSGLFRWAVRLGHATSNPLDLVERPKTKRHIEPCPTREEVAAMLRASRGRAERGALLALATSGLRRAELISLPWEHVDLAGRRMRIRGKGDKDREVPIFEELLMEPYALRAEHALPQTGPVFRGRQGSPLQLSTLQRWLKSWLRRATIVAPYTLHSLRRFVAKTWLDRGLNTRQVQLLLGHESVDTTILYLNYAFEEVHNSAMKISFGLALGECRQ